MEEVSPEETILTRAKKKMVKEIKKDIMLDPEKLVVKKKIIVPLVRKTEKSYNLYKEIKKEQMRKFEQKFSGKFRFVFNIIYVLSNSKI